MNTKSQTSLNFADDLSHNYIRVIEAGEHNQVLDLELLKTSSENFTKPVVFRDLVPLSPQVTTREFLEVDVDQQLLWREKQGDQGVAFRDQDGKTDYNYVSGVEGSAQEYLDQIFIENKDVYAHLGKVSSGFKELHKFPWGKTIFEHIKEEVFHSEWFQIPGWELSGHCFLGNNTEMFADPSSGAPGSDWHMFPTINTFVMIAGTKKWMSRPPQPGDQHRNQEELVFPTGGRECPLEEHEYDTVYLQSGDVLVNVPFEWHKVLNAKGWSLGAAFRVIDRPYVDQLRTYPAIAANLKLKKMSDDYAHLATSLRIASNDPRRMQMSLNCAEMMICTAARFDFMGR